MRKVNAGEKAPVFNLVDQEQKNADLGGIIGTAGIILSFHPLAWTSVCAQQMKDLESKFDEFQKRHAVAFGMSIDTQPSKKAWAESLGITKTRLLSDFWPHGRVAQLYDVFIDKFGFSERAVFIIDKQGIISFKKIYPMKQVPDINEIVGEIEKII